MSVETDLTTEQPIGKGLIILLHGEPGVGKTSTAGNSEHPCPIRSLKLT